MPTAKDQDLGRLDKTVPTTKVRNQANRFK